MNISGSFREINIRPDYAALGLRNGLGLGLGLIATPAAALLSFVEPGLGKSADCAGLLYAAQERVQP